MFKSVFTKYISVFMLILVMSFFVLNSILTSLVNTFNTDVKMNSMADAAYSVSVYLRHDFSQSTDFSQATVEDFDEYLYTHGSWIMPVIDLLSVNIDHMVLWIVDADGRRLPHQRGH